MRRGPSLPTFMYTGLATLLAEGEGEEKTDGDRDFLSSVEIVIADRADVFLMQNWAHVVSGALNIIQTPAVHFYASCKHAVDPYLLLPGLQ